VRLGVLLLALAACKSKSAPSKQHDAQVPRDAAAAVAVDVTAAVPARVEHAVWTAANNAASAHLSVGGELVVDARSSAFARYIRWGFDRWTLATTLDGEPAAQLDKLANLEVPLIPEQPAPTQITARVYAAGPTFLELRVNGRKLKRIGLETGWQTVAATMPPSATHPGENVIALSSRDKLGLQWLRVGATHPAADDVPLASAVFDPAGDSIELDSGASVTWYTELPEGANVVAEVAPPCGVDVGARATDASYAGGLVSGSDDRVDLSALGGKVVRLSLTARDCPRAHIANARVTINGPAPSRLPPGAPPRAVVLLHVATLQGVLDDDLARATVVFRHFLWSEPAEPIFTATLRATSGDIDSYIGKHLDEPFILHADTTDDPHAHIARTIAIIKARGLWDRVMLLVATNDVLVVHDPARFPSGTLVDEGADGRDIVPAIQAALGQRPDAPLIALAQGAGRGWPRVSYAHDGARYTARIGGHTLTVTGGQATGELTPIERRMLTDALALEIGQP
jgi:hypothetical protein